MNTIDTIEEMQYVAGGLKREGKNIALVPTMGFLHEGHASLLREGRRRGDILVLSIFVNPIQFGQNEDLDRYPRDMERDCRIAAECGVDIVFTPDAAGMYPLGFQTSVRVRDLSLPLCGASRPGHFDGVATVVTKLLGMTGADRAYFGQKDWQQLQVVQTLVADLNLPVTIVGCETVREPDGLALSSRNARLSPAGRAKAPALHAAMQAAAAAIRAGEPERQALREAGEAVMAAGFERVEYLTLRDGATLRPPVAPGRPMRLLAAAWLDGVRLIDNIPV